MVLAAAVAPLLTAKIGARLAVEKRYGGGEVVTAWLKNVWLKPAAAPAGGERVTPVTGLAGPLPD